MALTVLVVNDDLTQRRLLEAAINSHGYDVKTGKSGETAIAFMQSEKTENVHLMLLELAMSDQDKFEVLQKYQIQLARRSNHRIDGPKRDQKNSQGNAGGCGRLYLETDQSGAVASL
nr:response regulator [Alphaproteobacteria bacterium]